MKALTWHGNAGVRAGKKDAPARVARVGFEATMRGGDTVRGSHNKLQSPLANVTPVGRLAERHKKMAAPGSARR